MTIDGSPCLNKVVLYTSDPLQDSIYISSGKSISNLTAPYESSQGIVLNSHGPNTHQSIISDNPCHVRG